MTADGASALREELNRLKSTERPRIVQEISANLKTVVFSNSEAWVVFFAKSGSWVVMLVFGGRWQHHHQQHRHSDQYLRVRGYATPTKEEAHGDEARAPRLGGESVCS